MPERTVYISGQFVPESQATISIFDSAVMVGDTATESTRTFRHQPFKLPQHIRRLYQSLKIMRIDPGLSSAEMTQATLETVERNLACYAADDDLWIVHNVSRGEFHPTGDLAAAAGDDFDPHGSDDPGLLGGVLRPRLPRRYAPHAGHAGTVAGPQG